MVPELIIEELPIVSWKTDELKTVEVWAVSMTFFYNIKFRSVLYISEWFKKYPQ